MALLRSGNTASPRMLHADFFVRSKEQADFSGPALLPFDALLLAALLRVEQRHRGIDDDFEEAGSLVRQRALQRRYQLGRSRSAYGVATMSFGDPDEIDAGQIEARNVAHLHHLAERAH